MSCITSVITPLIRECKRRWKFFGLKAKGVPHKDISLAAGVNNKTLVIYSDVAALKQELLVGKEQLKARLNEYFQEKVVDDIVIK